MAIDRIIPNSTTPGAILGDPFMDAVQEELTGLWNFAPVLLTAVSGTNTITATPVPALTGALVDGMNFVLTPAVTTTSGTVSLDVGTGAKTVVDRNGAAPAIGALVAASRYLVNWNSGLNKFMVLSYLPPLAFVDRPSFRNVIINGGMEIWQRGAGDSASMPVGASATAYTADRWYMSTNANQAYTVNRAGPLSVRSRASAAPQRNAGQTGTGTIVFAYPLTTEEVTRLRGTKASLSFLAAGAANWSPTSGTITATFYVGTGAEGRRGAGFTSETTVLTGSVNVPTSGVVQSFAQTSAAVVPTTATQGEIRFTWVPVGTAGAADACFFDDVQLEATATPTEFEYAPFGFMLRECQRHYAKTFAYNTAPAQNAGVAGSVSTDKDMTAWHVGLDIDIAAAFSALGGGDPVRRSPNNNNVYGGVLYWRYPVKMRVSPTVTTFNPSNTNSNIRYPSGNNAASAGEGACALSPNNNTNEDGASVYGNSGTIGTGGGSAFSSFSASYQLTGILHMTADAGL